MGKFTALAQSYINYVQDIKQFSDMPKWRRELAIYNSKPPKKVSLSPSTMDDAHKALEHILSISPSRSK